MAITETRPPTESTADDGRARAVHRAPRPRAERSRRLPRHRRPPVPRAGLHRGLAAARRAGRSPMRRSTRPTGSKTHPSFTQHLFQVYTSSRVTLVFLVGIPLLIGLATCITPLQVGRQHGRLPPGRGDGLLGLARRLGSGGGRLRHRRRSGRWPGQGRRPQLRRPRAGAGLAARGLRLHRHDRRSPCAPPGLWLDRVPDVLLVDGRGRHACGC